MSLIIDNSVLSNKPDNDSNGGNTSNSDNPNENGKRMKKRSTKKELYKKEREEIINELSEIIGLDEKNNSVFLYELERNEKINEYIQINLKRIRQYHKTGTWGYFSNDISKGMGNNIGLIRTLYTDNDYNILSKLKINNFDNIKKQYTLLLFCKKNV